VNGINAGDNGLPRLHLESAVKVVMKIEGGNLQPI
jgi:hypothetical protein